MQKAYQEFLNGERTAVVADDIVDGNKDTFVMMFTAGEVVDIEDIEKEYEEISYKSYRYIDMGMDNVSELELYFKQTSDLYGWGSLEVVIKYIDGQLYMVFKQVWGEGGASWWLTETGEYGLFMGLGGWTSILDKNGKSHDICGFYYDDIEYYEGENQQEAQIFYDIGYKVYQKYGVSPTDWVYSFEGESTDYYVLDFSEDAEAYRDDIIAMYADAGITITSQEEIDAMIKEKESVYWENETSDVISEKVVYYDTTGEQ